MKKVLSLLSITTLTIVTNTAIFAQDENVFDLFDDVIEVTDSNAGDFGFVESDIIQVIDATPSKLTIGAPIVYDGADPILEYDLEFAAAPRVDLEASDAMNQVITVACNFSAQEIEGREEIECDLEV